MNVSNYEKIEIVFFYQSFDMSIHNSDLLKSGLSIRNTDIAREFNTSRIHNDKHKIYVLTPTQLIENKITIKKYLSQVSSDCVYGFCLVDDIEFPTTILMTKKIEQYRNEFQILSELHSPYSKNQLINALLTNVQHVYLYSNKETFEDLLNLRELESQAINDISKTIITGSETSSQNLVQLILKKSIEITSSDAGFVVLREGMFSVPKGATEIAKSIANVKSCRLEKKANLLKSQNVQILPELLDVEKSQITRHLMVNGTGVSWFDGVNQDVVIRGKNQFMPRYIPEFSFDHRTYKIKSYCAFPIRKPGAEVEGFIILFNKKTSSNILLDSVADIDNHVVAYSLHELNLLESLANQAGVSFAHARLIGDLRNAFESFTAASITAIESRDPSTKGHSERVAALTVGLAETINKTESGLYGGVNFSRLQIEEIRYASLLHDFGKIGVREHVLQKEKKFFPHQLEKIENRFTSIKDKLYIHILENYIEKLISKNEIPTLEALEKYKQEVYKVSQELGNFWNIILELNEPSVLNKEFFERMSEIATMQIMIGDKAVSILTPEEINVLTIKRGSLSVQERLEIESHVTHSYNFLVQIPWTHELKNIPEIVYGHHERLDGSGYPRKLVSKEIPLQAKMMAITDVFDALVAKDRPYKKAIPIERAFQILEDEVRLGKLDGELLKLFIESNVWNLVKKMENAA
jgi:HD-GYP domain-containing protein (c-di-GMP phosphodiesterase class II)